MIKTLFYLEFKSSGKGTSISELQNIKIKRDNYNVYTHSNKTNINVFCSLAPNQNCGNFKLWFCKDDAELLWFAARVAHLFFLVQAIRFLIHDVIAAVDVLDAEAHKLPV